jgi:hypothetical protein
MRGWELHWGVLVIVSDPRWRSRMFTRKTTARGRFRRREPMRPVQGAAQGMAKLQVRGIGRKGIGGDEFCRSNWDSRRRRWEEKERKRHRWWGFNDEGKSRESAGTFWSEPRRHPRIQTREVPRNWPNDTWRLGRQTAELLPAMAVYQCMNWAPSTFFS